jgi:two-component system NtrC family response regulator
MSSAVDKLIFVEDDAGLRRQLAWSFTEYEVETAESRATGMQLLRQFKPAVAVIDLGLPPDAQGATEGLALLEEIRTEQPDTKVIVLTGSEDRSHALRAIELGAFDFCGKPMDVDVLRTIIQRALHLARLEGELRRTTKASSGPLKGIVTGAPAMLEICRLVEKIAASDISVMLTGESGTGKEVFARAIHDLSSRRDGPFVAINCGAIPENLLESELFGHEKGSFTGAVKQSIGKFELANKGTLLLDEIGDVPLPLQVKMLRFLQERVIERVGGRQLIPVDVRVICATHRNVPELISEQRFREDLYYRLNEFSLKIPALRERPGDAVLLAHFFLNEYNAEQRRNLKGFTAGARAALAAHNWPGNVRELQNRVRRAVVIADGDLITAENLELGEGAPGGDAEAAGGDLRMLTLKEIRQNADRKALEEVLAQVNGNVSQAAKVLGISRPTLYDLMRLHKVKL